MISHPLSHVVDRLDRFADATGRTVAWLSLAMVLVTFLIVLLRYLFNIGSIALQESVGWMHALLFMLGAAYTLRHDAHVRVDIFYRRMQPQQQAWVDLLGTLLLMLPLMIFILMSSWPYVVSAWAILERSPEAGGLPGLFLLKSAIPLLALLMLLQGVAIALRALLQLQRLPEDLIDD